MISSVLFADKKQFTDINGRKLWFVRYHEKSCRLVVWKEEGQGCALCTNIHASEVSKDILEFLGIGYSGSSQDLADTQPRDVEQKDDGKKPRRNLKAIDLPEMLVCQKCGAEQKLNKPYVVAKADKLGISVEDVVSGFECQKCTPTKGRKSSKSYDGVPDRLVCPCGHETKYHPSAIMSMAEKKGISVGELMKSYRCQKCNPTKGRSKMVIKEDVGPKKSA